MQPPPGYRLQSEDTSYEAELLLLERWRAMTLDQKAALTAQASRDLRSLTLAGLRQRLPEANEHELGIRFAVLAYGKELVERVMGITVPGEDTRIP